MKIQLEFRELNFISVIAIIEIGKLLLQYLGILNLSIQISFKVIETVELCRIAEKPVKSLKTEKDGFINVVIN